MYERFTDANRRAMQIANAEAQRLRHPYIDSEHMLLGLLQDSSSMAGVVLKELGLSEEELRADVEALAQERTDAEPRGKLPQTPHAKHAIEHGMSVARERQMRCVDTVSILLGILRSRGGVAATVLAQRGITEERVLAQLARTYGTEDPTAQIEGLRSGLPDGRAAAVVALVCAVAVILFVLFRFFS